MKTKSLKHLSIIALVGGWLAPAHSQTTVNSDAMGFVTVSAAAGTGAAKRSTFLSLPLYRTADITGQAVGRITSVTSNSIVNTNAGWTPGALSQPAFPYAIQITSGSGLGRIFLIGSSAGTGGALTATANTSTTLFIPNSEVSSLNNPVAAGVVQNDTYRIISVDTLSTAFPVSVGVLAGSSITNSDSISIVSGSSTANYWFSSSLNRWTRQAFGNPDASHVAILPNSGVQYQRLANTPLSFRLAGTVPDGRRQVQIRNSGTTILSRYWPSDSTLGSLNLQLIPGWKSAASASSADTVQISSGGSTTTHWFNGTNWKRSAFGNPNSDTTPIPVGTAISIRKLGSNAAFSTYTNNVPYALNP